jgi:hypothetical protein
MFQPFVDQPGRDVLKPKSVLTVRAAEKAAAVLDHPIELFFGTARSKGIALVTLESLAFDFPVALDDGIFHPGLPVIGGANPFIGPPDSARLEPAWARDGRLK